MQIFWSQCPMGSQNLARFFTISKWIMMLVVACGVGLPSTVVGAEDEVDFRTQIIPLLTKSGCNAGACHGAAVGRGGFKLSLYGGQPTSDYNAIVRAGQGRRINLADHEQSLLLRKPTTETPHEGGYLFSMTEPEGRLLSDWIQQGARLEPAGKSSAEPDLKLKSFAVNSRTTLVAEVPHQFDYQFVAEFSDGSSRDVTRWTVLTSNDPASVKVDETTNSVRVQRRGRHLLVGRYLDQVIPLEILVPLYDPPTNGPGGPPLNSQDGVPGSPAIAVEGTHFVDRLIEKKLAQLRIPVAGLADDATFFRRVNLDLTGRLPDPVKAKAFLRDTSAGKRAREVKALLDSPAFNDYWSYRLAQMLRLKSTRGEKQGVQVYHRWLRAQVAKRTPWNELVRELLLAQGDTYSVGQANFYRTVSTARLQAEFMSESLLGVKLRCANCHNHPLDHWTQDDYHGLAAIFATVKSQRVIQLDLSGRNIHARTSQPARPRIPGGKYLDLPTTGQLISTDLDADDLQIPDLRIPLTDWVVSEQNPYFAKAFVNRIWKHLMGRGFVEPVDDLRSTNPATHPELLDSLTRDFVEHGYDLHHLVSTICSTEAYQRCAGVGQVPESHRVFYANATVRPLSAEVLFDAMVKVTGVSETFEGVAKGTLAVQLVDPAMPAKSLDLLGRCDRTGSCSNSPSENLRGLATQLHLLNGGLINRRLVANQGLVRRLESIDDVDTMVRTVFEMAYGREPQQRELSFWRATFSNPDAASPAESRSDAQQRRELIEDFVWSVLTSREFTTNH